MTANTTFSPASSHANALRANSTFFAAINAVARWWQVRQDERLLLSQPDHLLLDVGIERKNIRAVLRGDLQR